MGLGALGYTVTSAAVGGDPGCSVPARPCAVCCFRPGCPQGDSSALTLWSMLQLTNSPLLTLTLASASCIAFRRSSN